MKKYIFSLILLTLAASTFAQDKKDKKEGLKRIDQGHSENISVIINDALKGSFMVMKDLEDIDFDFDIPDFDFDHINVDISEHDFDFDIDFPEIDIDIPDFEFDFNFDQKEMEELKKEIKELKKELKKIKEKKDED